MFSGNFWYFFFDFSLDKPGQQLVDLLPLRGEMLVDFDAGLAVYIELLTAWGGYGLACQAIRPVLNIGGQNDHLLL